MHDRDNPRLLLRRQRSCKNAHLSPQSHLPRCMKNLHGVSLFGIIGRRPFGPVGAAGAGAPKAREGAACEKAPDAPGGWYPL